MFFRHTGIRQADKIVPRLTTSRQSVNNTLPEHLQVDTREAQEAAYDSESQEEEDCSNYTTYNYSTEHRYSKSDQQSTYTSISGKQLWWVFYKYHITIHHSTGPSRSCP